MPDITRTDFIYGLMAAMTAPILGQDSPRTSLKPPSRENANEVASIVLTDFILPDHENATDGFIDFITALNNSPHNSLDGIISPGTYILDSSKIAQSVPIILRDGITIRGEGKPKLVVAGTAAISSLLRFHNCSGRVENIAFAGNGKGTGYTNGSALHFLVDNMAIKSSAFMEVVDCAFENFRSTSWLYGYVSNRDFGIDRVVISNNNIISRTGNSIEPDAVGMRSAAVLLQSKYDHLHGGGGIYNVTITNNIVDARHIKSGFFLSDNIKKCMVAHNKVIGAGLYGALNNAGSYAFAAYDSDQLGMRDIVFADNEIDGVRSVGIYCAGPANVTIDRLVGRDQIDTSDSTLPKGLIVMNGVSHVTIRNVTADNIADAAICVVTSVKGTVADIQDINVTRSQRAIYLASAYGTSVVAVKGVRTRECLYGILGNLIDGGAARAWTLSTLDIVSAVPGSIGVRIFAEGKMPVCPDLKIGGSSMIDTVHAGVVVAQLHAGTIALAGIAFMNSFESAAIVADGTHGLTLDALRFEGQGATGYCLRLEAAQGFFGKAITFRDIAPGHITSGPRARFKPSSPIES